MRFIVPLSALLCLTTLSAFQPARASVGEKVVNPEKKNPGIFILTTIELTKETEHIAFISVSEIYRISEHPDSLAIPDISEKTFEESQYLPLTGKYRNQFLTGTGISEQDQVFIFDYASGKQLSFPVQKLQVVACVDPYTGAEDMPLRPWHYMIGFAIDKSKLAKIEKPYYATALASIGKTSPFEAKLTPLAWKKTDPKLFPSTVKSQELREELASFYPKTTYSFTLDSLDYFVQEGSHGENNPSRHVLVQDNRSKAVVFERVYMTSESTGMAPLNFQDAEYVLQWTGQLFKGRDPVIFGFTYESFSCEEISFIGTSSEDIYIKCDNRH